MGYCTAQDVIERCTWPGFGQLSAGAQTALIETASEKLGEVTRHRYGFASQSVVESFDGRDQTELILSLTPVASIESITIDGEALDNTDGLAWAFDANTGRVTRGRGYGDPTFYRVWPAGEDNITVAYTGGGTPSQRLITATAFLVRYLYDVGKVSGAYAQETIGSYTRSIREVALTAGVPDHVMGLLQGLVQDDAFE